MSAEIKGILVGAGGVTLLFALLFGALFAFGFGVRPEEDGYTIEAGEKRLMLDAVTYDETMYVPIDAVSFLLGRDTVVDKQSKKISFIGDETNTSKTNAPSQQNGEDAFVPAILREAREFNEKNQGRILLKCDEEIIYPNSENKWKWALFMSSANGETIEVERIDCYIMSSTNEYTYNEMYSLKGSDLEAYYGTAKLVGKRQQRLGYGMSAKSDVVYMVFFAYGADEEGREAQGALRLLFSKEQKAEEGAQGVAAAASGYDTATLRHNASFRVEVADGVYWVPANALGKSSMTADEIRALGNDPETLKDHIDTLYEVIQYLQVSGFKDANDNIRLQDGDLRWEHHKPGELAVTTNEGCCATVSNLLNYLLEGDYEEVGFIAYTQSDINGHVFNYIKHNGFFYFVDLTHYRNDFMETAVEDGTLQQYRSVDFIAGNIHEAASAEDYVKYCLDSYNDPPELFSIYAAENVLPISNFSQGDALSMIYPRSAESIVTILYDKQGDKVSYSFSDSPTQYPPEWEPYNTRWE